MLIIKKEGNSNVSTTPQYDPLLKSVHRRQENHSYNIMLYILRNYSDLSEEDQFIIYSKMSFVNAHKPMFIRLRTRVLNDYNNKVDQDSVTLTDLKAGYHLSNGMLEMHFDSIEQLNDQLMFYEQEFIKERSKDHPNLDNMAKISLVVERLINRRSILNVGTPIILFFRSHIQKQNMEMQQLKERYQQKSLDEIIITEDKNQGKHIEDSNSIVTSTENIDELERFAKLKDSRITAARGNAHKQNNDTTNEKLRVQSVTNVSNQTSFGKQDPSSKDNRSSNERRTKEAVF